MKRHAAKWPQSALPHDIANKCERMIRIRSAQRAQELRQLQERAATHQICRMVRCHGEPVVATFAGQNRPHAIKARVPDER